MAWNFSSASLATAIAIIFLTLLWKMVNYLLSKSNIPSPKGDWFIIGHLFEIRKSKDIIETIDNWARTCGPIFQCRTLGIFGKTVYVVSDIEAVKQVLVSKSYKYGKPGSLPAIPFLPTKSLVFANGKEHVRMKKMIKPIFNVSNLKSMPKIFEEKANLLAEYWVDTINGTSKSNKESRLPVESDLSRLTLDALGKSVFGCNINSIENDDTSEIRAFTDLLDGINPSVNTLMGRLLSYFPFLQWHTESLEKRRKAMEIITKLVKQTIAGKLEKKIDQSTAQKNLLDLLLEAVDDETGEGMDEEELFSQVFLFLLAGYGTSATTLSWILFFLAQYPEVQEKLRQEVEVTLNEKEECWETYDSMKYLTSVINESQRLCPVSPLFRRVVLREDKILGHNIPAGSLVLVPVFSLHRKPEYWSDPETFNPERFLEPNRQDNPNHRYAFIPFSSGPRSCIAYRFALMEMKIVLSILIRKFSFSMIPGMSFKGSMFGIYKPTPNLELLVRKIVE
ncbi:cytochrome P450 3A16-like [Dendronephthya gigantea]|uniref:cytochrome P450 3A16-like n=1 Tax=Dendronephthya gigantea TaxID=151771 RepID=UPI00106D9013|nr:cytochrome P450 3A16-like [Dendronephthya gigantea]